MQFENRKTQAVKRPHKWHLRKTCYFLLFLIILCIFTIDYKRYKDHFSNFYEPYLEKNFIEYKKLSNEINDPIDYKEALSPRRDVDYRALIQKYSDVRFCLVQSEQTKQIPDLRFIDWNRIDDFTSTEICIWRIFSSYGDIVKIFQWTEFHGMRKVSENCIPTNITQDYCFDFSVDMNKYGSLSGNDYFQRRLKLFLPWSESIYVVFDGLRIKSLSLNFQRI